MICGLAQLLEKLAKIRESREIVGYGLRATLDDREPFFGVGLADLGHEFRDALLSGAPLRPRDRNPDRPRPAGSCKS